MNDKNIVELLRSSSRTMVRELGMLNGTFEDTGLNYSQCHVLINLGTGALRNSDLAEMLNLEKSSVTRLIDSLKEQELVTESISSEDSRNKFITLTEKGKKRLNVVNALADGAVEGALDFLSEDDKVMALKGIELYAKALQKANLRRKCKIRKIEEADDPVVAKLIRTVLRDYAAGEGTAMADPELDYMFKTYNKVGSMYFVVEYKEKVVGCAGIAPLKGGDNYICELQKMYFLPEARGLGLGSALLKTALSEAKNIGYTKCYLETLGSMGAAIKLYESKGFVRSIDRLGNTGHTSCDLFYVKTLD